MEWLTKLWRRLFKREAKPVDPIPYLGSLAPVYKAVALAEPLPPPKNWHSAWEGLPPPGSVNPTYELWNPANYRNAAEEAMREMERTDRRAQLVAAGLLADAAEADRDQKLEGKMDGWMRRGCPCTDCYARRKASN